MVSKKNNTKRSTSAETPSHSVSTRGKESNSNVILIAILILVVIQLMVLFGVMMGGQGSNLANPNLVTKINSIESKVNAIDNFFASNVDGYGSGSPNTGAPQAAPSVDPSSIDIEGEPSKGDANAPVTIVEFSDYECPFCGRFYTESFGQLKQEYIDTGKVRFVYKDFPLSFHPRAKPAAIAANCVLAQLGDETYFEYHNTLFENQQMMTDSNLKTWATQLGVNEAEFDSCLADPQVSAEIDEDMAEGSALGVSGTPSFFINGQLLVGAQPYSVIKQTIENQLNS